MAGEIEVLVYSGRANPRVALDRSTEAELTSRLSALKPLEHAFASPDGLGYRGLRIVSTSAPAVAEVEVAAGQVRVRVRDGGTGDLADPGRALERWLLGVLASRLPAGDRPVVEEVLRELGSSNGVGGSPRRT
jgi:hypothetical protein